MGLINAYFNYKAQQIQSQTDKENAQLQYDAAMQQIDAQKEANAQQQAFNKEEAELAFKRNSSAGQLKQLMDAGLSEMQARQIIAGGSAGSYTAAPSVNQMSGVDYTAPAAAKAASNQADANAAMATNAFTGEAVNFSSLGMIDGLYSGSLDVVKNAPSIAAGVLQTSLTAADGGILGAMSTAPLQGTLMQHINEIPADARGSYAAFCSYVSSAAAPAWCKTADFQHQMQLATSSPMAMRAMRDFFTTDNQLLTGEQYWKQMVSDTEMKSAAAKISSFKVDQEKVATDLSMIESDYKIAILPERYSAMLTSYQQEIAEMSTKRDLWNNVDFKRAYIASKLKNEEDAAILAKVMKMKHQGQFDYLNNNADRSQLFAIYQLFADAGMTDSLFGEVVASIEAYGQTALEFGVTDILKDCKDWIGTKSNNKKVKSAKSELWLNYLDYHHHPHQ